MKHPKKDLLPCPFCGGPGEIDEGKNCAGHGDYYDDIYVICSVCYARGPSFDNYQEEITKEKLEEKAIASWNNRTSATNTTREAPNGTTAE